MSDLTLTRIHKTFGRFTAVEPTDLVFREGELTALLGPSGCGKTTLLRMIAGLEAPTSGKIRLGAEDITDRPAHHRKFGMVFQSFALFPHLSVLENVGYSLKIAGVGRAERQDTARRLLDLVQLTQFASRRIGELSGGQRQRVAIARALAQEPRVFLLDEPMSALDAKLREEMQVELRLLQQRLGITTIVVTHDQREAMTMADNIVVMSAGRVEQIGPPQQIYNHPANSFVASFIGRANFLQGHVVDGTISVPGAKLALERAANFLDGSPVTVAIRPERTWLGGEMPEDNCIDARITFVRDVGATRDIYLETPAGQIIVEYAIGEKARTFTVGRTSPCPPAACSAACLPGGERSRMSVGAADIDQPAATGLTVPRLQQPMLGRVAFALLIVLLCLLPFLLVVVISLGEKIEGADWRWATSLSNYQRFFVGADPEAPTRSCTSNASGSRSTTPPLPPCWRSRARSRLHT